MVDMDRLHVLKKFQQLAGKCCGCAARCQIEDNLLLAENMTLTLADVPTKSTLAFRREAVRLEPELIRSASSRTLTGTFDADNDR